MSASTPSMCARVTALTKNALVSVLLQRKHSWQCRSALRLLLALSAAAAALLRSCPQHCSCKTQNTKGMHRAGCDQEEGVPLGGGRRLCGCVREGIVHHASAWGRRAHDHRHAAWQLRRRLQAAKRPLSGPASAVLCGNSGELAWLPSQRHAAVPFHRKSVSAQNATICGCARNTITTALAKTDVSKPQAFQG